MSTKFASVSELRQSIIEPNAGWAEKMLHAVPKMDVVKDRAAYLVESAKGKVVLDIGCTGAISKQIRLAAKTYYGVDKEAADGVVAVDIDHRPDQIPVYEGVETVIMSEVLEHLANPGYFLAVLKKLYPANVFVLTVPNAGAFSMKGECEVVHHDHVSWYSYTTLKALVTRYGYSIKYAAWYNGVPYKAEGLIMVLT